MCFPCKISGKRETLDTLGRVGEGTYRQAKRELTILPVNPVSAYSVSGQINGHEIYLVVDTGAAVTLMPMGQSKAARVALAPLGGW